MEMLAPSSTPVAKAGLSATSKRVTPLRFSTFTTGNRPRVMPLYMRAG